MQNKFGKKLEEARTRRGISIRQASDDLKIRLDFLLSFENDDGNFSMPDVYKIGFIKLYAKYLKLDPTEIANDFNAFHYSDNKNKQNSERENLGRIELIIPEAISPPQNKLNLRDDDDESKIDSENLTFKKPSYPTNKAFYVKFGLIVSGSLAALMTIIILVSNTFSNPKPKSLAESNSFEKKLHNDAKHAIEELILSGEDNIHVVVRQEHDKLRLFSGNIDKTHPVTISRQGPVKIHFSDGSKLSIQKPDGKKINPGREGMGWIEL